MKGRILRIKRYGKGADIRYKRLAEDLKKKTQKLTPCKPPNQ